ncbi:MAG: hypothetical protein KBD36_03280 [Alphaproteobacteria bacterium]|jgi:hypothetical protein|nr:hypothetical protein [Alphaproteobacteria bacterium]
MGAYLATGIVQNICMRKKDIGAKVAMETIKAALQKEVHLDHYAYSEDDTGVCWTLKPYMLEGNLPEFLESQFKMYDEQNKKWQEDLKQITQAQTGQERLDLAQNNSLVRFQMIKPIYSYLDVEQENGFETHIMLTYDLIAFFVDGKIVMECYNNILSYFTKNLRLQNQQYPISNCLKIMITS